MDADNPEITRFIVSNGKILETDETLIRNLTDEITDSVDLNGDVILPGLADAHLHLFSYGFSLLQPDLTGLNSIGEIREKLEVSISENPGLPVLKGRGWDQNLWADQRMPSAEDLEGLSEKPILLTRVDGHAIWVNRAAIQRAGITKTTPDPPGGKILRYPDGTPAGVFIDEAVQLVSRVFPPPSESDQVSALKKAVGVLNGFGLTSIHDAGTTLQELKILKKIASEPWFSLRVYSLVSADSQTWSFYRKRGPETGLADGKLTIRGVKIYADGALGSRGAKLTESYTDQPENSGLWVTSPSGITDLVQQAVSAGFQPAIHCIGDEATEFSAKLSGEIKAANRINYRIRLEHAQVMNKQGLYYLVNSGAIASMQPQHAVSDMSWAFSRLGPERLAGAYIWRTISDQGVLLALGSDAPVEIPDPFLGIYSAVTRQDRKGNPVGGWYPKQALTLPEALAGYTTGPAFASFTERFQGQLKPGFLADFIAVDQDIFEILPSDLWKVHVKKVWFDGKRVYGTKLHR